MKIVIGEKLGFELIQNFYFKMQIKKFSYVFKTFLWENIRLKVKFIRIYLYSVRFPIIASVLCNSLINCLLIVKFIIILRFTSSR